MSVVGWAVIVIRDVEGTLLVESFSVDIVAS